MNSNDNYDFVIKLALTAVFSAAFLTAGMNVGWQAFVRRQDRKKELMKEALNVGHRYLNIIDQLEAFAKSCEESLDQISDALDRLRSFHDTSGFGRALPTLRYDREEDWTILPLQFAAKLRVLAARFAHCNSWIGAQYGESSDIADIYVLHEQQLAYYALEACKLATQIRAQINVDGGTTDQLVPYFQDRLDGWLEWYREHPERRYQFIPELLSQFDRPSPVSRRGRISKALTAIKTKLLG